MRFIIDLTILGALILCTSCQANPTGTPVPQPVTFTPFEEGKITMPPPIQTPADSGLQKLIESSRKDLAQRLTIPIDDIVLLETESVTWPDSSLGCPQKGMAYAQVLTPGYLIRLQAGNTVYEYHASRGSTVIYCENPVPPVGGTPSDI